MTATAQGFALAADRSVRPSRTPDCAALGVPFEETVAGRCARYPALARLLVVYIGTAGVLHETTPEWLAAQRSARERDEARGPEWIARGEYPGYWTCLCDTRRYVHDVCPVCGYDGYNAVRASVALLPDYAPHDYGAREGATYRVPDESSIAARVFGATTEKAA